MPEQFDVIIWLSEDGYAHVVVRAGNGWPLSHEIYEYTPVTTG